MDRIPGTITAVDAARTLAIPPSAVLLRRIARIQRPIDLRWDRGLYSILGVSLAEGPGYRFLSEPDAVQYSPARPPLAGHRYGEPVAKVCSGLWELVHDRAVRVYRRQVADRRQ